MKPAAMPLTARSRRGQVERSNMPCAFARVTTLSSVLPMRRNVSAELADSQYLHNQANGGKNAHHHDSET